MKYYAHTALGWDGQQEADENQWQLLRDHSANVARLARTFAEPLGLGDEAWHAGLLHDLGKYSHRFQARLRNPAIRGINHWAAGTTQAATSPRVSFAIDGHHTGIPSRDGDGIRQTIARMRDELEREAFCRCPEPIAELVRRFENDGLRLPTSKAPSSDRLFAESIRIRMLFSCLVDADFLDTEDHFSPGQSREREAPELQAERALQLLLQRLEAMPCETELHHRRRKLLADCLSAGASAPGLFNLTAPTGSGKTLSSLAFALRHIQHHNAGMSEQDPRRFRRIIVVIPFTSIIEQSARVYRDHFEPEFGPHYVLEHHSAVAPAEQDEALAKDAEDSLSRRVRLAHENWASPLVVTTNVQFFQSLFSNKPSHCRKLHNVGRSVIIFDEVQTLPPRLIPSLLSGVKILTQDYGVSAVFMTATQPAFATAGGAVIGGWEPKPIATDESGLAEALRRTRIELPPPAQMLPWAALADLLTHDTQALCVVNTTKDARRLFELLSARFHEGVFHLSSRLCPQHRRNTLQVIRQRLHDGLPCRLISTQIIEAGVDVDFPIAYRALGPLDSIIQTAGRCNREGKSPAPGRVIVFRPEEMHTPPGAYRIATEKTVEFLARHPDAAQRLHLPEFYAAYFRELYGLLGPAEAKDDPLFAACDALDFPRAAKECSLIGDETRPVLVKWDRGLELADKLRVQQHMTSAECREAQQFSVNLYQHEFLAARVNGYLYQPAEGWDFWVWNSDYHPNLGLGHTGPDDYNL